MAATGGPEALADIAKRAGLTYKLVSSDELDGMSLDQMMKYGAFAWPGGYATQQSNSIKAATRERIRRAVNEGGMGFSGYCAGAFIAVSPAPSSGMAGPEWGLALRDEPTLDYYYLESEGVDTKMTPVELADGTTRNLLWWGGPKTPEYPHGVVARYSDTKEPAISQSWAGNGLMVISGPHPEAPADWRSKLGLNDTDGLDQDIAAAMILASLYGKPMKALN